MNIDGIFQDPEYENFVCVYLGLAFIGQILEQYTRNGIQHVHQKIQTALAGSLPCPGTCGNNSSRWCETCKKWQKKLRAFSRQQEFDWTKQESWKWTLSYEYIASIFTSLPGGPVNFRDLSTACSIWTNCKEFNIQPFALQNVKDCRNKYFAHNDTLKVTDAEKARAFDALADLLKQGDVQNHINKQDCLNKLEEIKNGKSIPTEIARISEVIKKISNDEDRIVKIVTELTESDTDDREELHRIQNLVLKLHERQRREHVFLRARLDVISNRLRNMSSYIECLCVGIGILVAIAIVYFSMSYLQRDETRELITPPSRSYRNSIDNKYSGCLSESHKYPFSLDVRLLGYLPTENKLIGREWVYDELEQNIFQQNSTSRGTLMIAEYGFGKSAIVAHLLCTRENEKGWKLRQHTVAFHICKFNTEITKNPVQLIKRLIWFLSIKSAEYGQYIEMLESSIIDDDKKCEENIYACFDLAITNPLDKLTIPNDVPWIVVIDALDECMENDGSNRILDLLSDRLIFMQQKGRKWFKWIITSRNTTSLVRLDKLNTINFPFDDKRNYEDIRHFIIKQGNISDVRSLDTFVHKSEGNILYIKHALEYIVESGNVSVRNIVKLPRGIEEIYELNFDRLFKNNNDFGVAKHILQLISIKKFHSADVLRIIKAIKTTNESEFGRIMNKLSFFIAPDCYVTFRHRSLYDWLISNTNLKYRLSLRAGHVVVSEYLFNITDVNDLQPALSNDGKLFTSEPFNELAYHVSESKETYLQRQFFSVKLSPGKNHSNNLKLYPNSLDHILSNKMLKLIVKFVKEKAAHYGRFIRFFRIIYDSITTYNRYNDLGFVSFIRENILHVYEIDQYPLHTAAAVCNTEIARYLINDVDISHWISDDEGLRAIDIAYLCGCTSVSKIIAEKDPSVYDTPTVILAACSYPELWKSYLYELLENRRKHKHLDETLNKLTKSRIMNDRIISDFIDVFSESSIEGDDINFKKHSVFKIIADLHPELLSYSDISGYTPALQFIMLNNHNGFSAIVDISIDDKCQPVSSGMLYIYYVFTVKKSNAHRLIYYPMYRWIIYHPIYYWIMHLGAPCPEDASVEHLLMRHKRIDMINLVIANGYIMNWTKTDREGNTPLDYADQMFILQLECHFGVDIDVLSDRDKLAQLCLCEWFYFYLLLFLFALDVSISLLCIVLRLFNVK